MQIENITLSKERNVILTAYIQSVEGEFIGVSKRPAVLILPGGGYFSCSDREADPVAFPYLKAGYQAFILRYSVGSDSVWPNPLNDYDEAMQLIRERADTWNVYEDKIAVIGFSARGHLAACAATMSKNRPNAAILGYPVIEGECIKEYQKTAPDVIASIDYRICPCFVFAARTDNVVPVKNTVSLLNALVDYDIPFESHIYSNGPHGFSTCDSSLQLLLKGICNRVPHWVEDSLEWLKDVLGDFGNGQMTAPQFGNKINGNHDEYLNIDCTMEYLFSKPEAMLIVQPILDASQKQNEQVSSQMESGSLMTVIKAMTLRQMLEYGDVPDETLEQINQQLGKIKND